MATMDNFYSTSSKESEIDARLDALIAKISTGRATGREKAEFEELLASRTRLMRPRASVRYSSSRLISSSGMRRRFA